jgi:hypothetical protein
MLTELRRFNYLGTPNFFQTLITTLISSQCKSVTKAELKEGFSNKLIDSQNNFDGAINFAVIIGVLSESNNFIYINKDFSEIYKEVNDLNYAVLYKFFLTVKSKKYLGEVFTSENFEYHYNLNEIFIKKSAFQLKYNNIRSFLIDFGFLNLRQERDDLFYFVNSNYYYFLDGSILSKLSKNKRRISVSQFEKSLELKKSYGHEAELFVFKFEKNRLSSSQNIDWVALHTINEGYDIASYDCATDKYQNRFIEVKSYDGESPYFYLSENEYNTANKLGNSYWLYLVNRKYMHEPDYQAVMIQNPSKSIFTNSQWNRNEEKTYKFSSNT